MYLIDKFCSINFFFIIMIIFFKLNKIYECEVMYVMWYLRIWCKGYYYIFLDFLEIVIIGICCVLIFVEFIIGYDSNFKRLLKWDVI